MSEGNPFIKRSPNTETIRDSAQKRISIQRVPVGSRASSLFSSPQPNGAGVWTPSPVASPEQIHDPQFSGVTRGLASPRSVPDELKDSVSKAWERGRETGMYEPLREDSHSGNTHSNGGIGLDRLNASGSHENMRQNAESQHTRDEEDIEEDLSKQYSRWSLSPCTKFRHCAKTFALRSRLPALQFKTRRSSS